MKLAIASILAASIGENGSKHISKAICCLSTYLDVHLCCWFWLVTASSKMWQNISVAFNFATTFVLSQTFLTMLCHFTYGAFLFFAGWIVVMTIFIVMFLPETKGVTLNLMYQVWDNTDFGVEELIIPKLYV